MKKLLIFLIVSVVALGIGTSIQVRANPLQDYEVIERVNYIDDNWELTSLPFTLNDNWQEYGLRFYLYFGEEQATTGVVYFSSVFSQEGITGYITGPTNAELFDATILAVVDIFGESYQISALTGLLPDDSGSWIELIRVIPNIDTKYNEGFNEGYSRGVAQNFSSFGSFLTNSVGSFLNFEIFPGFSIMNVLWAILGVLLFIIILRVFAGG